MTHPSVDTDSILSIDSGEPVPGQSDAIHMLKGESVEYVPQSCRRGVILLIPLYDAEAIRRSNILGDVSIQVNSLTQGATRREYVPGPEPNSRTLESSVRYPSSERMLTTL